MKKILFILVLLVSVITLQAQPLIGLHGSLDLFTSKPTNDDYTMAIKPYSWGVDIYKFSFQYSENHLCEPYSQTVWEEDLHDYPDIIDEKKEIYKSNGYRSFSIFLIPTISKLKGFYIGFGIGLVQTYDITSILETHYHKYEPCTNTNSNYIEISNKKSIPSLNFNLRYNLLEFININDELIGVYLSPMITITTCDKIKPMFGLAFGLGFMQSRK